MPKIARLLLVVLLLSFSNAKATTYYSKASGDPSVIANWGVNPDGTGANPTLGFIIPGDVFVIRSGSIMTSATSWSVLLGTIQINSGGALNIGTGGDCSAGTFTNAGTISVSGSGIISATVANTGTINLSTTGAITGITNNAAGIVNLTNSGTITTFNNATATSTLNIIDPTPTITTLTVSAVGNTVNYTGAGNQAIKDVAYYNLSTSGSGVKSWTVSNRTMYGNLSVGDGTTLSVAGNNKTLTVTGTTTIGTGTSGILSITATGTKTFTGVVTINAGGAITETAAATLSFGNNVTITGTLTEFGAATVSFAGNLTNNGTYTASTGIHRFSGAAKTISGTASGTANTTTIPSITIDQTITNNNSLTSTSLGGGLGSLTNASTGTLNIGGNCGVGTLTNSGTINFSGLGTISSAVLSNSGTIFVTGSSVISSGPVSFTNIGTINLQGSGNITGGIKNNAGGVVNLSSSGTITGFNNATPTSILNISAVPVPTITTLTVGVAGNTVNYSGAGAQTVIAKAYSNLILSGSGAKSILNGGMSITANLSISNSATASIAAGAAISAGSLTLGGLGTASGSWGSTTSSATYKNNTYFTATTGIVNTGTDTRTTPMVTPTIGTYIYNGLAQGPNTATNTGTSSSYTFSYSGTNGTVYGPSTALPTNAGTYTATAIVAANGYYKSNSSSATAFTIYPQDLYISADDGSKCFGDTYPTGPGSTAFTSTGLQNGETIGSITITSTGADPIATPGPLYDIVPSAATGGTFMASNYDIIYNTGVLIIKAPPTATAGGSKIICSNGTATVSGATASGTILWTHNGAGSLSGTTALNPTYTAAAGDAGNTVTLTMTVSRAPCSAAIATYTVIVRAIPTATSGGSQTICSNGTAVVSGASSTNGTILWTHNGAGSISAGATTLTPTYTAVTGDAGNTVTLTMTVSNAPCSVATATYSIIVKALQTVTSVTAPATICKGLSATITSANITGTGSTYNLYDSSSGGVLIGTIPQTVSPTVTTTYYVEAVNSVGCPSLIRKPVTVTVYSLVDNTGTGFSSSSFCVGNQATITFNVNNGSGVSPYTLSYQNNATGVVYSQVIPDDNQTTFNLNPNPTVTTNYTLLSITDENGCVNSLPTDNTATVTINPLPTEPVIGTITQPTCALPSGSVVLSGLPNPWTLTQSGTSAATLSGTGTSTLISGLAPGNYNFTVSNGTCTSIASGNVVIDQLATNTWNGTSWSNGTPTSSQAIVFNGNYPPTPNPNLDLSGCSCQVTSGNVVINSGHTLTLTNAVTVSGGSLTFEDDASLVQINDVANTGNITYKRRTTPITNLDFTYWSSPVSPQTLYNVSPGTFWDKFLSFDSNINNWKQENSANLMKKGVGYIIRGSQARAAQNPPAPMGYDEAYFIGVPHNGAISLNGIGANKWCLIGNPYPSALDADAFLDANSGVLEGTIYFWTHKTAIQLATNIDPTKAGTGIYAYTSDDYATYNRTGGVSASAPAASGGEPPSGKIAAAQSFFSISKTGIPANSQIMFNNTMRVGVGGITGDNSQFFRMNTSSKIGAIERHRVWLNFANSQGAFKQTLVGYISGATNGYEGSFDGESFDGNKFVDFYSVNQDRNLTIQGRALPFDETDVVPLGYKTTIAGTFSISIDHVDGLLASQAVFLEDKDANIIKNLKEGAYSFTTEKGSFNNRFVLRYVSKTKRTLGASDFETQENSVLVSSKNKEITINSSIEMIDKVQVYDVLGKQIYKKLNVNNVEFSISNLGIAEQVLIVKVVLQNSKTVTNKLLFK